MIRIGQTKKWKPSKKTVNYILAKGAMIGRGTYRKVYKTKYGKWVVKVDSLSNPRVGGNESEYATYVSLRSALRNILPDNVRIPEMHLVNGYLVAEYVKGVQPKSWCGLDPDDGYKPYHNSSCDGKDCWINRLSGVRIRDIHPHNVILTDDDILYIIDLGHGEA